MVAPPAGNLANAVDPRDAGAPELPVSPVPRRTRRPRWLDLRLVTGVVLVVGSVLLGAVVVSRAASSTAVWQVRRDLPAGAVLAEDDLATVDVRLGDAAGRYVPAARAVVGTRLGSGVRGGELLPAAALGGGDDAGVTVSIPFEGADAPEVARGDRITVWLSTPTCRSVVLLADVGVQGVTTGGAGLAATDGRSVVVTVSPQLADRVVTALSLDDVTLRAGVLSGGPAAPSSPSSPSAGAGDDAGDLPSLAACGDAESTAGSAGSAGSTGSTGSSASPAAS